jgi:DNA-binding NarL/FixJ family response regulator
MSADTYRTAGRFSLWSVIRVGIAAQLYLSESSVEKHVNAIFTKLGLSAEQLSHRRVTAVLTFPRDAGLRG